MVLLEGDAGKMPLVNFKSCDNTYDRFRKSLQHIKQVAFQSNANHPLVDSTDYIKFEGM